MKKFFPERKHRSILTQAGIVITSFITCLYIFPTITHAVCSSVDSNTCSGSQSNWCGINQPPAGNFARFCCDTKTDCTNLTLTSRGQVANRTAVTGTTPAVDPTSGCPGSSSDNPQISTGLGCIPTSTAGFTSALLTFLAGTAGAISLIIMLIATIQIMTGGDNAEQVKKSKELFTGAITGLLFIIFSVTLLKIIAGDVIKLPGFGG